MGVPQNLTFITLGARNMAVMRAFYSGLGWVAREGSDEGFTAFDAGGIRLTLFPLGQLGLEAAPGEAQPSGWNGVTLGVNVNTTEAVDDACRQAVAAGAELIASPTRRAWGGYSGYVADPEGNRWEIVWAPGF